MTSYSSCIDGLCHFLDSSPTPWHATANMLSCLQDAGYERLDERHRWQLKPGGRYVVTRNDSSLIAFHLPLASLDGMRMIGAHTDSPGLRFKPRPDQSRAGWLQCGIEVYGGALLSPWFDRDLGVAGRVYFRTGDGNLEHALIHQESPVAMIPSLAIHLDRDANNGRKINPQTQMAPVMLQSPEGSIDDLITSWLFQQHAIEAIEILDHELAFLDCQSASLIGAKGELIASARLDNLLSCFAGMQAMSAQTSSLGALLVATDHEEVGSASACGAQGPFLENVLTRINEQLGQGTQESLIQLIQASCMVSCDNAHALHPNFPDRHDDQHGPAINQGPVLKVNANQRYATNSATGAMFREVCRDAGVPLQVFVTRADMGCGSTIGPITAASLGVPTVDVGVPQWAMHSIRETAGRHDIQYLIKALESFLKRTVISA